MTAKFAKVSGEVFSLPRNERAALAHALIQSLDERADDKVEDAWEVEIDRRIRAVEEGATTERDGFVALSEIRARLREKP